MVCVFVLGTNRADMNEMLFGGRLMSALETIFDHLHGRLASAHWRHLANTVHQSVQQCSLSQFQFILYYKLLCCPVVDILGHNTCTTQILSTVECSVACLCIYVLLSITSKPCKMAELIKMPFGVQVYGPRQPSI